MKYTEEVEVIAHTRNWIKKVVIGCRFCPFAEKVMTAGSVRFAVFTGGTMAMGLSFFMDEVKHLDHYEDTETTLVIFPGHLAGFPEYLRFLQDAERQLKRKGYDGTYQLASFHPMYKFENSEGDDDASNYTNRSVYPMLQLLREKSISRALKYFPQPEAIPDNNVSWARSKGIDYMRLLLASCID